MRAEVWKNERLIAVGDAVWQVLDADELNIGSSIKRIELFYFPHITMSPPPMFEHLAGAGLFGFFDRSRLVINERAIEPMRYVHGRSEVMRGSPKISSVLLALLEVSGVLYEQEWMSKLASIYRIFTEKYDSSQESA